LLNKYEVVKKQHSLIVQYHNDSGAQSGSAEKTWDFPAKGKVNRQENSMGAEASSLAPYL
jgi:hypothetical protein